MFDPEEFRERRTIPTPNPKPEPQTTRRPDHPPHLAQAAIATCRLCDTDGYTAAMQVCDHVDHRAAAKRGSEAVRQALAEAKARRA